jgi:DNA-directed RNA polymerase beta subunit
MLELFILLIKEKVDIDDLSNKRIRNIGEILIVKIGEVVNFFQKSFSRSVYNFYGKLRSSLIVNFFDIYYFRSYLMSFFSLNPLSQLLDEKNIFSEMSHKRRIYSGKAQSLTSLKIREIHPSQLGRICPIETVEGKRAGLVLNLAINSNVNEEGFMYSTFFLLFFKDYHFIM